MHIAQEMPRPARPKELHKVSKTKTEQQRKYNHKATFKSLSNKRDKILPVRP